MNYKERATHYLNITTTKEEKEIFGQLFKNDETSYRNIVFLKEAMLAHTYFRENGIKDQLSKIWDRNEQLIRLKKRNTLYFCGLSVSFILLLSCLTAIYWNKPKNAVVQNQTEQKFVTNNKTSFANRKRTETTTEKETNTNEPKIQTEQNRWLFKLKNTKTAK